MPGLLSLANELILSIADELDTRKIFRGTCRQINAVVSPRVFSYITIDIHEERLDVGISQLEALATRSTCTAEYVRTIDIRRLAPNYGPNMGYTFVNGKFVVDEDPKDPKTNWAQEKMRELLPGALSALKGATTAIWKACDRDPDWVSVLVSEFLGTLPALDSLHLIAPCEQFVPHLNRLRISSLTKLVVSSGPDAAIAKIIANNPCLTHLDVLVFRTFGSGDITTLHSLLEDVPLGQPLRLEHLRIGGCHIRFDHEILPHLRHLRSLKLSYLNFGPPRDLWRTVWRARIPLEAVTALVNDDLIDYLASVTGIKKIGLLGANTDVLANRFFTKVVPRHSKTLVSLSILPEFGGLWCFGKHNASILIECTQLSRLTIAIDTFSNGEREAIMDDIVNQIMGMAAHMPNLCWLQLFPAYGEMMRNASHATQDLVASHRKSASQALCKSISSFGPVDPAIRLNLILVGRRKFRPRRGADGVVRYIL